MVINRDKTKCMNFNSKKKQSEFLYLDNDKVELVHSFKYLGHFIKRDFSDDDDIDFRLKNFYSSFNSIFRDFKHVNIDTFMLLFNSYCVPTYGLPLWNNRSFKSNIFKCFEVAYNRALKKMYGVPMFASSHITANLCNQLLLKHHVSLTQARYFKRLKILKNPLIFNNLLSLYNGNTIKSIAALFNGIYNIDIFNEDLDVITSRILWVQRHEDRRGPCIFYGF